MPKRSLGAPRNPRGYAMQNTRKTILRKTRRNQPLTIPGKEKLSGKEGKKYADFYVLDLKSLYTKGASTINKSLKKIKIFITL